MEIYDIYRERYDHHVHHNSLSRHNIHHQFQQDHPTSSNECTEVLDLSRRCDSVETRKTPSPYATGSSLGTDSPSTQCGSPTNSTMLTSNSNKSLIMPTLPSYPIYYPPIKRETNSPVSNNNNNDAASISRHNSGSPTQVDFMKSIDLVKPITLITEKLSKNHQISSSTKHFDRSIDEAKSSISDRVIDQLPPLASSPAIPLIYPKILANDGKSTRPFKAYPRDPLVIAANFAATDVLYDGPRVERYTEYRKRVLEQIRSANGGQRTITNPKMRRANSRSSRISSRDEELTPSKVSALNKTRANSSESEDRCTESSDNDASSSTPTTTNCNNNNNNNNSTIPNQNGVVKDAAYYERRRKNNAAAKKSRDRRRIKEDEIAIRAAYLERQNIELLCQLDALKAQLASLTKSC